MKRLCHNLATALYMQGETEVRVVLALCMSLFRTPFARFFLPRRVKTTDQRGAAHTVFPGCRVRAGRGLVPLTRAPLCAGSQGVNTIKVHDEKGTGTR